MESLIETERISQALDKNYLEKNKSKPNVLLDSSFVLNDLLNRDDRIEFLELCSYLAKIRIAKVRLLGPVLTEIKSLVGNYNSDFQVQLALGKLNTIGGRHFYVYHYNRDIYKFLSKQLVKKGTAIALQEGKSLLSDVDIGYCVHAIILSERRDIIAATRDNLIKSTLTEIFNISHKVFINQNYPDTKLHFVQNRKELESLLH